MKAKDIIYKGKHLHRINARRVTNLINNYQNNLGLVIYVLPVNANPESLFMEFFEIELNSYNDSTYYLTMIREIQYYNCIEDLGNYLKFYVERTDKNERD